MSGFEYSTTPTVPGGHTCAKCLQFVEHGSTHKIMANERRCVTTTAGGNDIYHDWAVKPGGETHLKHSGSSHAHGEHVTHGVAKKHSVQHTATVRFNVEGIEDVNESLKRTREHLREISDVAAIIPPHNYRMIRSGLERAARELAGVNGHLESYRHHEDEEYVTVELIVRKDQV